MSRPSDEDVRIRRLGEPHQSFWRKRALPHRKVAVQEAGGGWISALRELGPWILSGYAVLQVWILAAWRHFRPGQVEIHLGGLTELGFSAFGPTVGVHGTLEGLHRSLFVEDMSVVVTRERDSAQHVLPWRAFRPLTLKLSGDPIEEVELPSGFLLRPEEPHRFNILFNDAQFVADAGPAVNSLPALWEEFRNDGLHAGRPATDERVEELFQEFSQTPAVTSAWERLTRDFYWHAGEYRVQLVVRSSRPEAEFTGDWGARLSEGDSDSLRTNAVAIIRSICGMRTYFHFAQLAPLDD